MIKISHLKARLGAALNDLGEALTAALAWIEEGEILQPFVAASKQAGLVPVSHFEKSRPAR